MRPYSGLIRIVPFVIAFAFAACSGDTQSPTAPDFEKSLVPAAAATAADESPVEVTADQPAARRGRLAQRAGEGGATAAEVQPEGAAPVVAAEGGKPKPPKPPKPGDDNGNGGQGELSVELQPDTWNTNWEHSQGTVSALLTGKDLGDIDASSIVLIGTDGAEAPLPAQRVQRSGNHLRAFFGKADALDTLDTPTRGETHVVTIRFTADNQTVELTDRVRIVGPAGNDDEGDDEEEDEELSLAIQPDTWNTNWARSAGTVSALLRGSDLDSIVLASIFLIGTDPAAAPLAPVRVQRAGNHVRAFFSKPAALATLETPAPGETHEVELHFTDASGPVELVDRVRIVGPGN